MRSARAVTTWWIDTTTLFKAFDVPGRRPTGIPRVASEMLRSARAAPPEGDRVAAVRYIPSLPGWREVPWDEVDRLLDHALAPSPALPTPSDLIRRLPEPVAEALKWGKRRVRASGASAVRQVRARFQRAKSSLAVTDAALIQHPFDPHDVWINFGCWWHGGTEAMATLRANGLSPFSCVLLHDCMPLLFPEFFPPSNLAEWESEMLPSTDLFLANSENTRRDIAEVVLGDRTRVEAVGRLHLGDTLPVPAREDAAAIRANLGLDEPYVLLVGTIEARKNHSLAFRAWRDLVRHRETPPPLLVFAGKWGWKVSDLRAQIRDSKALGGRIRVIENVDDHALAALYEGALLTLFPSLYEGWGLPIRESHAHGRVCIAARNSALVESGGDLAVYVETDCRPALVGAVERLLDNTEELARREEEIRRTFRPVSWETAWLNAVSEIRRYRRVASAGAPLKSGLNARTCA